MLLQALRRAEHRADAGALIAPRGLHQTLTGPISVTPDTTLTVGAAYRCVQLISDSIASLPLQAFRDGRQIDTPPLLRRPEADRPRVDTVASVVASLLIHGNAYLLVADRDFQGFPTVVVHVSPAAVSVQLRPDGRLVYRVAGRTLEADELIHVRGLTLPGSATGVGVLDYQRRTIAQAIAAEDYAGEQWTTGGVPDVALEHPGDLDPDEAEELKRSWVRAHGGRQRGPAIASGGLKVTPLSFSNVDLEMLESRKWNAVQVCGMFGVPPFLAGIPSGESKTYQNVQQDTQLFVRFTLRPWITRLEAAFDDHRPRTQTARFNLDALLRADTHERYQAHAIGLGSGFLTVDEVRDLENLDPDTTPTPTAPAVEQEAPT